VWPQRGHLCVAEPGDAELNLGTQGVTGIQFSNTNKWEVLSACVKHITNNFNSPGEE
jgi:hypothetical protein